MQSYEVYSRFYDDLEGDRAAHADYIQSLIVRNCPCARSVLELACGTGSLLTRLAAEYEVAGVDLSPAMLTRATAKLPGVQLVEGDMRVVDLERTFDVVLCAYDSINHLLQLDEWEAVFDRALAHLNPGGIFIFDVNTQCRLETLASEHPILQWFGDEHLLVVDVTESGGTYVWAIRVFEHLEDGLYRLCSEDIPEAAFPTDRIRESLGGRFRRVRIYDSRRTRPGPRSERLHFVCFA